jgi:TetR/AcrR family transcriptional regulator
MPEPAASTASSPLRRRRLSSDQRQRETVAAVLALAREQGPDAITTHAIAERMGVTQGALFRHFPDKQAIWLAVFAWVREALGARLEEAIGGARSPLNALEHAFEAHVAFVAENPGVPRMLFHELQYPATSPVRMEVRTMVVGYRKRLRALFADAKMRGELPASLNVDLAPVLFIGAVQGLVIQSALEGEDRASTRRARSAFGLLLDGYRGMPSKRERARQSGRERRLPSRG